MLRVPASLVGVYVTWQVEDVAVWLTSVHGEPAKVPAPLVAKLTLPVGDVGPIVAVSLTVTEHVVVWFITTEDGEHEIVVVVESVPKPIVVDP